MTGPLTILAGDNAAVVIRPRPSDEAAFIGTIAAIARRVMGPQVRL